MEKPRGGFINNSRLFLSLSRGGRFKNRYEIIDLKRNYPTRQKIYAKNLCDRAIFRDYQPSGYIFVETFKKRF